MRPRSLVQTRTWSDDIDPHTIPDAVLRSEWARRNSLKRKRFGAGAGRPKTWRRCSLCGVEMGTREFRKHRCQDLAASGAPQRQFQWKTRLVKGQFPGREFDI